MGTDIATNSAELPLPGGERGGVRGFERLLIDRVQYLFENAIEIPQHIVVPKAQDEITARFQILGSTRIIRMLICVLPIIEFDDELCVRAAEVDKSVQ
jgi:hypothetical protein